MESIDLFEKQLGIRGVSIRFYSNEIDTSNSELLRDVKFCQAVKIARDHPVLLDKDSISCKGARYAFGFEEEARKEIVKAIKVKRGISEETAKQLVKNIPRIRSSTFKYIRLNVDDPDILIYYINPKQFMEFLKVYQKTGTSLEVKLSSITAMCGDVAVQTFLSKNICISFGCDDSREYGRVADEDFIMGIPRKRIEQLTLLINPKGFRT